MALVLNGSTDTITGVAVGGISSTKAIADSAMPAGAIIQVAATNVTAPSSSNTVSFGGGQADTPCTVTITSSIANSKFLISGMVCGEATNVDHTLAFVLQRVVGGNATSINIGDAAGNRPRVTRIMEVGSYQNDDSTTPSSTTFPPYLDSPNQAVGTAITYKYILQNNSSQTNVTFHFGRTVNTADSISRERMPNHITVMEVAP